MSEPIRMSGMNSGFDTESIIEAMMTSYQTKIDNQSKKLTMLQWQQEAYQDITKKLTTFQNKYFDVLKRDSYINLNGTWDFAVCEAKPQDFDKTILVPFCPECLLSGIQELTFSEPCPPKNCTSVRSSEPSGFIRRISTCLSGG